MILFISTLEIVNVVTPDSTFSYEQLHLLVMMLLLILMVLNSF